MTYFVPAADEDDIRPARRHAIGAGGGTPGDTVVTEQSFGQAPSAGVASPYSRRDHTHGTPGDPIPAHEAAGDPHTQYATNADLTSHEAASDPHAGYQRESEKGVANGYPSLDAGGTIPDAQIPASIARDAETSAAIAAHEAAGDPHTQYATNTDLTNHEGAADPHTGYQRESEKGAANGYAGLGAGGLVPMAQLASGTPDGTKFIRDDGTLQTIAGGSPPILKMYFAVPILAGLIWTNQPAALSFWLQTASVDNYGQKIDLTNYTQCRLTVLKKGTAGAAAAKLILKYKAGSWTQTIANYSDIGTSEVSVAINVTNTLLQSAWINLVAGAKADVIVTLAGSGGDAALDPAFGVIYAEFK
jgi:hypothetical protein